ncbi:hypothetical protein ACG2LH_06910 [Zhouia sp. PK063]|uniref:hypothetical protein n=1 Tax=Zhouia sp. PK063 TaxID=3373602 RepID=UPI003787DDEE
MKKFIIIFIILILGIPGISYLLWRFQDPKQLAIVVFDKTVLNTQDQEHLSLFWLLNNQRYTKANGELYQHGKDYYGLFPDDKGEYEIHDFSNKTNESLDSLAKVTDVVYYTDMYGMYNVEWLATYFPEQLSDDSKIGDRSKLLYGGMNAKELSFLQKAKAQHKLIINEFNLMASPTSSSVRHAYEKTFDVKWSGWVGRYFDNLDTIVNKEIPRWLINNYKKQHNNTWPFSKSGIAFVNEDDRVEILENETNLNIEVPYIHTSDEFTKKFKVDREFKYSFWFDIVFPGKNTVISTYKIDANESGKAILANAGIPEVFPAAIMSKDERYFYFCGDFCDNPINMKSSYFKYVEEIDNFLYKKTTIERKSFFWKYYEPMLKNILKKEYKKKSGK